MALSVVSQVEWRSLSFTSRTVWAALLCTALGAGPTLIDPVPSWAAAIHVAITADNAYGFGFGTVSKIQTENYFGNIENIHSGDIFNCSANSGVELYTVSPTITDYLYIIAYSDKLVTQGVLGQFKRATGPATYTGQGPWEICATGVNFSIGSGGPTVAQINAEIVNCNTGIGNPSTTSDGWVNTTGTANGTLQFGEDNTTPRVTPTPGNEFPIVCQTEIDAAARWMWFNWDPVNIVWPTSSPFIWPGGAANVDKEFLIFRIPVTSIGCSQDSDCNDEDACNGTETCSQITGLCVPGTPVVCTALDQCHDSGVCNPNTGVCSNPSKPDNTPCSDGDACTQTDTCQGGACVGANPVLCTALDQCHVVGTCNPATGACSNPSKPDNTPCSDGDACTQTDTCQAGACVGGNPVVCTGVDSCGQVKLCEPATGQCKSQGDCVAVPALSELGRFTLGALLALIGLIALRRRMM